MYATHAKQTPSRRLRRQLIVAPILQGRLLLHVSLYCVGSSVLTAILLQLLASYIGDVPSWTLVAAAITPAAAIVIPIAMFDAARVSNRIVGPFVRIRGAVRRLSNNDPVQPLRVRAGDDWEEWIRDFNLLVARIQALNNLADLPDASRQPGHVTEPEGSKE
ncbi:MAG: hypothetical protein AAF497_04295 [Planctomycetota bacterium]